MSEAAAAAGFSRLLSDERLTRRAVGGDERAFAAIFRRYHQSLYRFCLAIVGNPEDAQDALQNTMIKVLRALPGEERKIELKPWLYRIAHNESIDLLRRRRETRELSVEEPAPGYGLAEDAATRERLRQLMTDLRALPDRQRDVLVMRELAGLEFEEIGVALTTSGAVARQTLYEARQSLRQMEEGREMGCDSVMKALSDGDGRVTRRRDVRAHLRSCAGCRGFRDEIKSRQRDLAALSPLPAVAAAGLLQGLIGSQAAAGGGIAAALGGGAAQTIGVSAAAKGAATVAVAAALGVTAADRTGVIHVLPGGPKTETTESSPAGHSQGSGHVNHGSRGVPDGNAGSGAGKESGGGLQEPGKARMEGRRSSVDASPKGVGQGQNGVATHGNSAAMGGSKTHEGSTPQGPPLEHPVGRGDEKQPPAAPTRGEETPSSQEPVAVEPPPAPDGGSGEPVVTPPEPAPPASAPSAKGKGASPPPPGGPETRPQPQPKPEPPSKPQPPANSQSHSQAAKPAAPEAASGVGSSE
jgi:RNA polymerase sigma factor (sigma-70 family)